MSYAGQDGEIDIVNYFLTSTKSLTEAIYNLINGPMTVSTLKMMIDHLFS